MTNEREVFTLHIEAYQRLVEQYIRANPGTDISRVNANRLRWYVVQPILPYQPINETRLVGKQSMHIGLNETSFVTRRFRDLPLNCLPRHIQGNRYHLSQSPPNKRRDGHRCSPFLTQP